MFRRMYLTMTVLMASLVVSACSGSPGQDITPAARPTTTATSASATPTTAASTTAAPDISDLDVKVPPKPTTTSAPQANQKLRGANAAPQATGGANAAPNVLDSIYDRSQAATDNYYMWYVYETQTPQDAQRPWNDVYYDGVSVCAWYAKNGASSSPNTMERYLQDVRGYTGSGAASIIKGALNALCPSQNLGYMTFFDREVQKAHSVFMSSFTWPQQQPTVYGIGWFAKEVCGFLEKYSSQVGLWEHLQQFRPGGQYANYQAAWLIGTAGDDITLRRFVHLASLNVCFGYHQYLNAYYTLA